MRIDRFSWSAYSSADLCGQIYYYRYVEKLRREPSASMLRGKGPHFAAEQSYLEVLKTGELLSESDVRDIATTQTRAAIRAEGLRQDAAYDEIPMHRLPSVLIDESAALAAEYRREIAPQIKPAHVELKIEIPPSTAWPFTMVGVIDVIDTTRLIHDTKTKRKAPAGDTAHKSGQLSNYEILHRAQFGEPSAGQRLDFIWQTPKTHEIKSVTQKTSRATHELAQFALRVKRMHEALEREVYIPAAADSWICSKKWCQFTEICPVFDAGRERATS